MTNVIPIRDPVRAFADQLADQALDGLGPRVVPAPAEPTTKPARTLRALSVTELEQLPEPVWLAPDFIPAGAVCVLYGEPGVGKSFVGLDWSLSIAAGLPTIGRPTTPVDVLYLAAEGVAGIPKRVAAWCEDRGVNADQLHRWRLIPEAVNLSDRADTERLTDLVAKQPTPPGLIVVDTLARSMAGAEENSAKDMGVVVDTVDRLRRIGRSADDVCTVLLIHHSRKSDDELRGSSALHGAIEVAHLIKSTGTNRMRLISKKVKDAAEYPPIDLVLKPVGESVTVSTDVGTVPLGRDAQDTALIEAAGTVCGTDPVSVTTLAAIAGVSRSDAYRRVQNLVKDGYLSAHKVGRYTRYGPGPALEIHDDEDDE